ncbi:MAG: hypothetical protein KC621_18140, partial [Myxococcales bacterium]|nr:hypothetical protein [Myxococcales bacterium]
MTAFWLGGTLAPGGHLELTSSSTALLWAAVAALAVFAAALPGRRSPLAAIGELGLVAAALGGLVFALAGPVWVEEEGHPEPGRVVALVDASRSMGVVEDGSPRSEQADAALAAVRAELGDVDVYHYGTELAIGAPSAYDLPGTDLEGALDALSERVAGERLAGVVLITDGLDRGLLRKRFLSEEQPTPPHLPGPLTVYQVGSRKDVVDLSVRAIDTGGYAFIRAPFTITADVLGVGFAGRTVSATLSRDGAIVTQQPVTLDAEGRGQVRFEVVPEDAGRFAYTVSVPVYEGDAVPANNVMPVVVKVVRDRIRVLQVAGAPSWDVKFLRRFLKDDPSVQLVSFFILRTREDLHSQYDERELSLIQFPYDRLFSDDLWSFDVVVFQNFDHQPYFDYRDTELLDNLRKYVEGGGALVMLGGDRSFGLGDYQGTPLAEVLPVEVSAKEVPDERPFQVALTAEGARHPITRVVAESAENELWWSRLHTLDGTNVVARAKPDAAVLLSHPTLKDADGQPLPVLAVREVREGRTMALTVDTSWRWSLSEAALGRGNQVYLRFWKNALRWLMKDASTSRVTAETARENYAVGEQVRIVVQARDPGFAPMPGVDVQVIVDNEGKRSTLRGKTSADGDLVLVTEASRPGTHRVAAMVTDGAGQPVGDADTVFAVTTRDPEMDEIAPDEAFLDWLARSSDGVLHGPGDLGPVLRDPGAVRTVRSRTETALWRAPLLILAITVCAGLAWLIRRRG